MHDEQSERGVQGIRETRLQYRTHTLEVQRRELDGVTNTVTRDNMEKKKVEQKDIAIGGTFEYKGKTYLCKETTPYDGCLGCALGINYDNVCDELQFRCAALNRKDHTDVIFVEV